MKTYQTDLPTMFGDHHVREVRRILLDLPGIDDIYASSAFQFLQFDYDESQVKEVEIIAVLEGAGYLGNLESPVETSIPATETDQAIFRHTQAFNQTRKVSFHRETVYSGRPLFPCPGMGPVTIVEED
jgi:hypothetical protein